MEIIEKLGKVGLIPVAVFENAADAVPTAKALAAGGVPVMEITMRTAAGIDAIRAVRKECPDVLVGAGTVLSFEKCKEVVEAGAQFIVAPGFNPEIVGWCVDNQIPVTPGCVTPTEIEMALGKGLKIVKFFPASVYGGVKGCAALYGPYKSVGVKFIPTGGVNEDNLSEFADKPFIHAIGGGWLCNPKDVAAGKFDKITEIAKRSVEIMMGFEMAHIGINIDGDKESESVVDALSDAFGFEKKLGNSSNFAGSGIEVLKSNGLGSCGHIAIRTNNIDRAIYYLENKGYEVDMSSAKFKGDKMVAVYLKNEIGGFAFHLLQK